MRGSISNRVVLGVLSLCLAAFALLGNILTVPLFFGVSFIFGSVAVMLAVALLGVVPAVLAAIVGGVYTLVIWGHPYALVIFTAEALVVGVAHRRWGRDLVTADLAYWGLIGVPLALLFYHGVLGMEWPPALLIALKQTLNGVFNALVASLLLLVVPMYWRGARRLGAPTPRVADLQFHVLLSAILLAGGVPLIHEGYTERAQQEGFLVEHLTERGRLVAARLTELRDADDLAWGRSLARQASSPDVGVALLDPDGRIRARHGELASVDGVRGSTQALGNGLSIWQPAGDMALMKRWLQSRYVVSLPVHDLPGVSRLVIEQPAKPLVRALELSSLKLFFYLTLLLLLSVFISVGLSRWLSHPLRRLQVISQDLPGQVAEGVRPQLPDSPIYEYASLTSSMEKMAKRLATSFQDMQQVHASLERQVVARTAELNQFKTTLDQTLDCVFMFDAEELRFFYANAGALLQIGYSEQALRGMHPYDITPDLDAEQFAELIAPLRAGEQPSITLETSHQRKDGKRLPVEIFLQYIAPDDQAARFVAIVRDITERRQAEAERERVATLLSNVLAAASEISIIATDAEGVITTFNRGAERMLGYSAEEMRGKQTPALIHLPSEVVARARELSAELGESIEGFRVFVEIPERRGAEKREWTYVHRDGRHIPVSLVVTTMRNPRGEIVGYLGIAADITEEKQAKAALRDHAQHTQAILDNMLDGIVTMTADGTIQSCNPAAEAMFGYDAEQLVGGDVRELMPEPHEQVHDRHVNDYLQTGLVQAIGAGREVEGRRCDGTLFPMEISVSQVSRGGESLFIGLVRDISERKRMEKMKSEFVSTVSHELRTPLTSISGALGLITGGALGEMPAQAAQMLEIAQKNSQRLSALINDLLDVEKLAAGKLHFDLQARPVSDLVQQALEANQAYGAERGVHFALRDEGDDAVVKVDEQRFLQVMSNLLSNAVKYSPQDGTVEVVVSRTADRARVSVRDHGPGVPAAFRERIFSKFAQADSSDTREKGGTGLGLAITRELLERMGGHIGFESEEGQGARFHFDLPLDRADGALATRGPAGGPRVLVVEDEADVAEVLGRLLGDAGYQVDLAMTGHAALAALARKDYAAVCLDLVLPDIYGPEVLRLIRERPEYADLPIVVVSAKVSGGKLELTGEFSHVDWLGKPVDPEQLLKKLRHAVQASDDVTPQVLHVEDDGDLAAVVHAMVRGHYDIAHADSVRAARDRLAAETFAVVILDLDLPDGSGWELLAEIRRRHPDTSVVILSGTNTTADETRKVEAALLKSQMSSDQLLDALGARIKPRHASEAGR